MCDGSGFPAGTRLFSGPKNPALETPGYYQMFLRNINQDGRLIALSRNLLTNPTTSLSAQRPS